MPASYVKKFCHGFGGMLLKMVSLCVYTTYYTHE